jgi:hypothetical protein
LPHESWSCAYREGVYVPWWRRPSTRWQVSPQRGWQRDGSVPRSGRAFAAGRLNLRSAGPPPVIDCGDFQQLTINKYFYYKILFIHCKCVNHNFTAHLAVPDRSSENTNAI